MSRREWLIAGMTFVLSVGISTLLNYWIAPPEVVQFDLKGTVNLFTSELAQDKNLSPADAEAMTTAFSSSLANSVKTYAARHHVVVLVSPAVMNGAPDVTAAIQAMTKNNMTRPA